MNKVDFLSLQGLRLTGLFHKGTLESVIVMGHGFTGDKVEWGSFDRIAEEFNVAGYSVFRFDYAGCGESADAPLSVARHCIDYKAALNYVQSLGFSSIGFFGYSISGLVALEVKDPRVKALVFAAPVTAAKLNAEGRFDEFQLKELQDTGFITRYRDKGPRTKIIIDGISIKEREQVNQTELLRNLGLPVLIFHGREDDNVPYEHSVSAMRLLPKGSKLITLENEGHHLIQNTSAITKPSIEWYNTHL